MVASGIDATKRRHSARGKRLAHLDTILALVAAGSTLKAACNSRKDFPAVHQVDHRLATDPVLRARFRALLPKRASATQIAAVIAAVDGGVLMKTACATHGLKVAAFQFKVLRHAALRARFVEAKANGAAIRLRHGTLQHADDILKLVEAGISVRVACASDARFPGMSTFLNAIDTDPDLRWRYDEAIAKKKMARSRRARLRMLSLGKLSATDIAERAGAAIPKSLPSDTRLEIINTVVLTVLEGDLDYRRVAAEAKRLHGEHRRTQFGGDDASIDKTFGPDSSFTFGDVLSNSWD